MIICPNCAVKNPIANKFCKTCGTSLYKDCPECSAKVTYDALNCPNSDCDALTGTLWWAIISEPVAESQPTNEESLEVSNSEQKTQQLEDSSTELLVNNEYLDPEKRYRLRPLFSPSREREEMLKTLNSNSSTKWLVRQVLDTVPLQKSKLKVNLEQQEAQQLEQLEQVSEAIGIPAIALPYLTLQEFSPAVPKTHDAWDEDGNQVVLLEDRSRWQMLSELWRSQNIPMGQILFWLGEMVQLWEPLSQIGCCQSLLLEINLRVDEDQKFCLQQLYDDPPNSQLTLKDLGQMWQGLFSNIARTESDAVVQLLDEMVKGSIETAEELQTKIKDALARDQEQDAPTMVLSMRLRSLTDAGSTDVGRQRDHNEDYYGIQTQIHYEENRLGRKVHARGLYIVCDGMGGHDSGEIASIMAVETLQRYFQTHWQKDELPDRETIEEGILLANQTIYDVNVKNARSGIGRMGTTLVIALVQDTKVAIAHVGDSRVYRLYKNIRHDKERGEKEIALEQLTIDHEVGQREIKLGVDPEIAYSRPDAYQLTQALGPRDNKLIKPDIEFLELNEDTIILLCSDGLCDNDLIENRWETHLKPLISSQANLEKGVRKLIDLANNHNGHDNITAIIVRVKVQPNLEEQPLF
ncbi:MAG: serine/threonine phosphatase [Moorea sp. SIO2B7]|nr:serine/threonine phosphatase [Moorena sp. SIO2B7]